MKILVADDHPLVLAGMRGVLAELDPAAVVLEARSLREVLEQISVHPDLALMLLDLRMPGMEGVGSVRRVVDAAPIVPVVVVSAFQAPALADELAAAGAVGLIPKSLSAPVVAAALRRVLAGEVYFPAALFAEGRENAVLGHDPEPVPPHLAARLATLTRRERDVLEHLSTGLSNKEIARVLGCSDGTVKVHVKAILKKFEVSSRAVVIAMMHGRG